MAGVRLLPANFAQTIAKNLLFGWKFSLTLFKPSNSCILGLALCAEYVL